MTRVAKIDNSIRKRLKYKKPKREQRRTICKILIVCEGKKTEPHYFEHFNGKQKGAFVYDIDTDGGGINTLGVVELALELRQQAIANGKPYDSVWAVFDRDSFKEDNFDNAVNKANSHKINSAWSNEAFELWYLLHFNDVQHKMGRAEYKAAISDAVNSSPLYKNRKSPYEYAKNDPENYIIINKYGDQELAINRALKMRERFDDYRFHTHNPCTAVCNLVLQLEGCDKEFNDLISKKLEGK